MEQMVADLMIDKHLDARGLLCPEPLMLLHQAVNEMAAGEVLSMRATDPSAQRDIEKFCQYLGHECLAVERIDDTWHFWLKKSQPL